MTNQRMSLKGRAPRPVAAYSSNAARLLASGAAGALALAIAFGAAEARSEDAPPVRSPGLSPLDVESILNRNAKPKESAFDFPEIDNALAPWFEFKESLSEDYGLTLGFDYQAVAQTANNTVGDDSAVGGFFRFFGTLDVIGKDTLNKGSIVFNVQNRHRIGTDLPPESLAPNFGWAGLTAPDFSDEGWGVTELYWRMQALAGLPLEVRVGRLSAFGFFNVTPASDTNTSFMNNNLVLSSTVGYAPGGSLGVAAFGGITENIYTIATVIDANGGYDQIGFESLGDGEFFKGLEVGWSDRGVTNDSFRLNDIHVSLWHRDEIDATGADEGWGVSVAGYKWFDEPRTGVFLRAGWADEDSGTLNEKALSAGVVGNYNKDDLTGIGVGWGQAPGNDEDQISTEAFYRWQLAQNLALTPSVQVLFNPAFNEEDDTVVVGSLRARFTF